jgi:hypothetical protein
MNDTPAAVAVILDTGSAVSTKSIPFVDLSADWTLFGKRFSNENLTI